MKYCPNRACPHRLRVRSPAEFQDRIAMCSDCGTPLVDSEQEAIAGLDPLKPSPYRDLAAPAAPSLTELREKAKSNDRVVGMTAIVLGAGLTGVTYMLAAPGGRFTLAFGPVLYGLYRIFRAPRVAPPRR